VLTALKQHFGFDHFLPGQADAIGHLLEGHSTAAVFPTGGGKSLCYQLPALLLPGLTLVVSPLIALMKDQIDALQRRGIESARLDSSLSLDEYRAVMDKVRSGQLRLLYVAPERFNNERFRQALEGIHIGLFAVDEAHCISEWGHNFRPDYLKLAGFARQYQAERILALTATATPRVLDDICSGFDINPQHAVRTGFFRRCRGSGSTSRRTRCPTSRAHLEKTGGRHCACCTLAGDRRCNSSVRLSRQGRSRRRRSSRCPPDSVRTYRDGRHNGPATLLARVFRIDVTNCPDCGARMKIIAALTDPSSIRRCLQGMRLPARAPPIAPARPDPQPQFDYA
jgi:hypothetical protein